MVSRESDRFLPKQEIFFVDTKTTCFLCLLNINKEDVDMDAGEGEEAQTEEDKPFPLRRIFKLLHLDPGRLLSKKLTAGPFLGSPLATTDLSIALCTTCRPVCRQLSSVFSEWEVLQMKLDHSLHNFLYILRQSENDSSRMTAFRKQVSNPLDLLHGSITQLMRQETLERGMKHLQRSLPRVSVTAVRKVPPSRPANDPLPAEVSLITTTINTNMGTYNCSICYLSCQTTGGLRQHMKWRHREHYMSSMVVTRPQKKKYACHHCGAQYQHRPSLARHTRQHCKFRFASPPPSPPPEEEAMGNDEDMPGSNDVLSEAELSLEELLRSAPRIKGEEGEDHYLCSLCPSSTDHNFTEDFQLKEHLLTSHLDHFFASAKLPHCSQSRFRALCTQLLREELTSSFVEDHCKEEIMFGCVRCPFQCTEDKWSMYSHMIQDHSSFYVSKLKELQGSKRPLPTPNSLVTPSSVQGSRYKCIGCRRGYPNYFEYRRHKVRHHCRSSRRPSSDIRTPSFRCSDCGGEFISKKSVCRHQKLYCLRRRTAPSVPRSSKLNRDPVVSSDPSTSSSVPSKSIQKTTRRTRYDCEMCGKQFTKYGNLRNHRQRNCPCKLPETAEVATPSIPRNPRLSFVCCRTCGKYLHITGIPRHGRTACPYRSREDFAGQPHSKRDPLTLYKCRCEDCTQEFSIHTDLQHHILESHPWKAKCKCGGYYTNTTQHARVCKARGNTTPSQKSIPKRTYDMCEYCGDLLSNEMVCPCRRLPPKKKAEGFHCTTCGKKVGNSTSLLRHMKMSCPYRNVEDGGAGAPSEFACCHCQVEYRLLSELRRHVASIHVRNVKAPTYTCEYCGATLSCQSHLIRHKKVSCAATKVARATRDAQMCRNTEKINDPTMNITPETAQRNDVVDVEGPPAGKKTSFQRAEPRGGEGDENVTLLVPEEDEDPLLFL